MPAHGHAVIDLVVDAGDTVLQGFWAPIHIQGLSLDAGWPQSLPSLESLWDGTRHTGSAFPELSTMAPWRWILFFYNVIKSVLSRLLGMKWKSLNSWRHTYQEADIDTESKTSSPRQPLLQIAQLSRFLISFISLSTGCNCSLIISSSHRTGNVGPTFVFLFT